MSRELNAELVRLADEMAETLLTLHTCCEHDCTDEERAADALVARYKAARIDGSGATK